MHQQGRLSTGW